MLTPKFSVEQDGTHVIVRAHLPQVRTQEIETCVSDDEFRLSARPYFLRLHFRGPLAEDDGTEGGPTQARLEYDAGSGWLVIALPKRNPGEHFGDLDMLSRLLTPKATGIPAQQALIEVVQGSSLPSTHLQEDIDWSIDQRLVQEDEPPSSALALAVYYGFNRQYSGIFGPHGDEFAGMLDLSQNPDSISEADRGVDQLERENAKFDPEHYAADYMDPSPLEGALAYVTYWNRLLARRFASLAAPTDPSDLLGHLVGGTQVAEQHAAQAVQAELALFSDAEQAQLRELPRRDYMVEDVRGVLLGLVDLLFAYSYNLRTTEGESTVESAWTLARLSPLLSCLSQPRDASLKATLVASYRRALAYPLFRHFALCQRVREDVATILALGRVAVLRALLAVKYALDRDETFHIVARIYLADYCAWIQGEGLEAHVGQLAEAVRMTTVDKADVGWDLDGIEAAAAEQQG